MQNRSKKILPFKQISIGVGVCIAAALVGTFFLSWLINSGSVQVKYIDYGTLCVLLISAILGAVAAMQGIEQNRLLVCGLVAVGYFLFLICCTAMLFEGEYQGVWVTFLPIFAGCLCVALLRPAKNKKKSLKKKFVNR